MVFAHEGGTATGPPGEGAPAAANESVMWREAEVPQAVGGRGRGGGDRCRSFGANVATSAGAAGREKAGKGLSFAKAEEKEARNAAAAPARVRGREVHR